MMNISKVHPLESLDLRSRPLAHHALSWSCDAELAVATDNSIYIFLPEYAKPGSGGDASSSDLFQPQFSLSFQTLALIKADPGINTQLCASAGVTLSKETLREDESFKGVGDGSVTGAGAALGQAVRVEWSPNGLGSNLRPVLTTMTTNGSLVTYGEHIDHRSSIVTGMRARSFKNWRVLWGLGAHLPIPDAKRKKGFRLMNERIVSFSWAREILPGRGLLAYTTHKGHVVIMAVQLTPGQSESQDASDEDMVWQIQEVCRFDGNGPHRIDNADADFVPSGTAFGLKWSPWLVQESSQTATLAYVAPSYVGFRRITVNGVWRLGQLPEIELSETDSISTCLPLSPDAFIEWEDVIWEHEDGPTARGVVATPHVVKPFHVTLTGPLSPAVPKHRIQECAAIPTEDEDSSTNPITGLVIHRPDPDVESPVPYYSLVRLSATATNLDWYQTTLPEEENAYVPQWAAKVQRRTARLASRGAALLGADFDSDSDEDEAEEPDEPEEPEAMAVDNQPPSDMQIHPYRFRFWGMALSPGGGCSAVLLSQYATQLPDRRGTSTVVFGYRTETNTTEAQAQAQAPPISETLTTEGRLWETTYSTTQAPATNQDTTNLPQQPTHQPIRFLFAPAIQKQTCVFCHTKMTNNDDEAVCENGHPFATCAASGLAIMAPGVSRVCAVCGLRCLKVSELKMVADEFLGAGTVVGSSGEVCGGCGGKFVV